MKNHRGSKSGIGSPADIVPSGSNGQRRESSNPELPHLSFFDMFGSSNFRKRASKAIPVNCSNQTGALLNISVNLDDSSLSPIIVG